MKKKQQPSPKKKKKTTLPLLGNSPAMQIADVERSQRGDKGEPEQPLMVRQVRAHAGLLEAPSNVHGHGCIFQADVFSIIMASALTPTDSSGLIKLYGIFVLEFQ